MSAGRDRRASPLAVLGNAGWLTGGRLAGDAASFGLFIAVSRHFGPAGVGEYAYGLAIAGFVAFLVGLGLSEFGIREVARLPEPDGVALLGKLLVTQFVLLGVASVVLGGFVALTRPGSRALAIIVLLAVQQVALMFSRTFYVPAYAAQRMRGPAVASAVCRIGGIILTLVLVIMGWPLAPALIGYPLGGLALLALSMRSARRFTGRLRIAAARHEIVHLARTAWPFGASEAVFLLYTRADLVMLAWIGGSVAAGIYASSLKFFEIGTVPMYFLGLAAFPALSRLFHDRNTALGQHARRFIFAVAALGALIAWGLFFVIPVALVPLLGPGFREAGLVVRLMAPLALLAAVDSAGTRLLLATHRQLTRFRFQAVATGLNVALDALLIPRFGIPGALAATAVALLASSTLYLRVLRNQVALDALARTLLSAALPVAAATTAAVVAHAVGWPLWAQAGSSLAALMVLFPLSALTLFPRSAPLATAGSAPAGG